MQNKYELLMVGTDTEVFLRDAKTSKPVTAIGRIGGTKHEPLPVPSLGEGFFIQEDNVMPEYNVPACRSSKVWVDNLLAMRGFLDNLVGKQGLQIDVSPAKHFDPRQLDHPQAKHIGCEPDFCVYTQDVNPSPADSPLLQTMRSAGGHIHVSFLVNGKPPEDIYVREPLIKALDVTLGLPSLWLDTDTDRKQLYGRGGSFRPKDYGNNGGIEYRVLSNFWTKTPKLMRWAFEGVEAAFWLLSKDEKYLNSIFDYTRRVIHSGGDRANGHLALTYAGLVSRAGLKENYRDNHSYFEDVFKPSL